MVNGFNINEEELLARYARARELEIDRLLNQYGNSLSEVREMYPQFMGTLERRRAVTGIPNEPLFFTPTEAKDMGVSLSEDWMLKFTPGKNGDRYKASLITPEKWELTEDDLFISPTGESYSRDDIEKSLKAAIGEGEVTTPEPSKQDRTWQVKPDGTWQEVEVVGQPEIEAEAPTGFFGTEPTAAYKEQLYERKLQIEDIFGKVFPEDEIEEVWEYAQNDPEGFTADIKEIGWTADTEKLLKLLDEDMTETDIQDFFAPVGRVRTATPLWQVPLGSYSLKAQDENKIREFANKEPELFRQAMLYEGDLDWARQELISWGWSDKVIGTYLQDNLAGKFVRGEWLPDALEDYWQLYWGGVGEMIGSLSGLAKRVGQTGFAETLEKIGLEGRLITIDVDMGKPDTPEWYAKNLTRMIPMMLGLIDVSLATGGTATGIVASAGGGTLLQTVTGAITAGAVSSVGEGLMEASEAYNEAERRGMSEAERDQVFNEVLRGNVAMLSASNTLQFGAGFFIPGGKSLPFLVKALIFGFEGASEGLEEGAQLAIAREALGDVHAMDEEMWQNVKLGLAGGLGFGTVSSIFNSVKSDIRTQMTEDQKATWQARVDDFMKQGDTRAEAEMKAWDNYAETEQGTKIITDTVQARIEQEKQAAQDKLPQAMKALDYMHEQLKAQGVPSDIADNAKQLAYETIKSKIEADTKSTINRIMENNTSLNVPVGEQFGVGVKDTTTLRQPSTEEPFVSLPTDDEILKGMLVPNWIRTTVKAVSRIPKVGKVAEAFLGWRSLVDRNSKLTEDIVGRGAVVYGAIQRMGKAISNLEVGVLRNLISNPVEYFGFNDTGYSAKMAKRLLPDFADQAKIAGTLEHVFTHPEMYSWARMDEGLSYVTRVNRINKWVNNLLGSEGIGVDSVNERWIHRVVTGKTVEGEVVEVRGRKGMAGSRPGTTPSYKRPRSFKTMAEGIQNHIMYEPNIEVSIGTYIEEAFKEMGSTRFTKSVEEFGVTPSERLKERHPEVVKKADLTKAELAGAAKLQSVINRAMRGEILPEMTLREMRTKFPELGRKLDYLVAEARTEAETTRNIKALKEYPTRQGRLPSTKEIREAVRMMPYEERLTLRAQLLDLVARTNDANGKIILGIVSDVDSNPMYIPKTEPKPPTPEVPTPSVEEVLKGLPIKDKAISEIKVDADRFQFKQRATRDTGETGVLAEATWNPELAGLTYGWEAKDGTLYIVNGHQRLALAKRSGAKTILIRFDREVDGVTEQDARAKGAVINIAEDRGTPFDVAKFLRDSEKDLSYLTQWGVTARGRLASEGSAIAALDDSVYNKVAIGQLDEHAAAIIGRDLAQDFANQRVITKEYLDKQLTYKQLVAIIKEAKWAGTTKVTQKTLFGETEEEKSLLLARAKLRVAVEDALAKDKRLFSYVTATGRPEALARGKTVVDVETGRQMAQESATAQAIYEAKANAVGVINDIMRDASEQIVKGGKANVITRQTINRIREAITSGEALIPTRLVTTTEGGRVPEIEPDTGEVTPAEAEAARTAEPAEPVETLQAQISQLEAELMQGGRNIAPIQAQATQEGLTDTQYLARLQEIRSETYIPKAEEGMPEAGLQQDIFGYQTPVFPKAKGEVTQVSMDDYKKLVDTYEKAGLPPPEAEVKPQVEGQPGLETEPQAQKVTYTTPTTKTAAERQRELNQLRKEAKELVESRKAPYWQAKHERARMMKIVSRPDFGENYLMMPFASGRIFDQEFVDSVNKFFGYKEGNPVLKMTSDANSILRITKASLDFSAMMIQGLPSFGLAHTYLFVNPAKGIKLLGAWYRAYYDSTRAFFSPGVFYGYLAKNEQLAAQRLRFGGSSRSIDYFDALRTRGLLTGGFRWLTKKTGVFTLYDRAEVSFNSAGEIVRDEFWKILSPKALKQGKGFELARHLDIITGLNEAQAMGVPLTIRQLESSFAWFAPNYTRACLTVLSDIFRGGYSGAHARAALGGMLVAGSAYYIGVQLAISFLSGKDEDEAWEDVKTGFGIREDPITGEVTWRPLSDFMGIKVGNYTFAPGGFWYGLVRLAGNINECINQVGDKETIDLVKILKHGGLNKDNPFVYWWYTRAAPMVGTGFDLATHKDFLGYPIETEQEYAYYIATRFEPIWMEQGINWMIPGLVRNYEIPEGAARAAVPVFEIFGWRSVPESTWVAFYDSVNEKIKNLLPESELDPKQVDAWKAGKLGWGELTKKQKQDLIERDPELADLYEEAQNDSKVRQTPEWEAYTERVDTERAIYQERVDELTRRLTDGELNTREYRELAGEAGSNYGSIMESITRDKTYASIFEYFEKKEAEGSKYAFTFDMALAEYDSQIRFAEDPGIYLSNGDYDWDERDKRVDTFIANWGQKMYDDILDYISGQKEEKGLNSVWIRKSEDTEKLGREYWRLPYKPIGEMDADDDTEGNIPAQYYTLWKTYQALPEEEREGFELLHPDIVKDWRREYRKANPEMDARLALWGYSGKLQTMAAYNLVEKWGKELGIPISQMGLGLPSQSLMPSYFQYADLLIDYKAQSPQIKLWRLQNPAFNNWAMEQWGWQGLENYKGMEYYELQIKNQPLEKEYSSIDYKDREARLKYLETHPEFRDDRNRMKAMDYEIPEPLLDTYVEYYRMERTGYSDDLFLVNNPEFYDVMVGKEIWKPREFKPKAYYEIAIKNEPLEAEYSAIDADNRIARQQYLEAHPEFRDDRNRLKAMDYGLADSLVEDFVEYYSVTRKDYEDDWYLMEHKDFYNAMYDLGIWKEPRDFSKVPTQEVWNLYQTYKGLPTGTPRNDFRAKHPELDAWLVLKFGYKPIGERGDKEAPATPSETKEAIERFKELFK